MRLKPRHKPRPRFALGPLLARQPRVEPDLHGEDQPAKRLIGNADEQLADHVDDLEVLRRRYRKQEGDKAWIAPLATALQHFQIIYLIGSIFVGIAYQPFAWLMLAVQIGLDQHVTRLERTDRDKVSKQAVALA